MVVVERICPRAISRPDVRGRVEAGRRRESVVVGRAGVLAVRRDVRLRKRAGVALHPPRAVVGARHDRVCLGPEAGACAEGRRAKTDRALRADEREPGRGQTETGRAKPEVVLSVLREVDPAERVRVEPRSGRQRTERVRAGAERELRRRLLVADNERGAGKGRRPRPHVVFVEVRRRDLPRLRDHVPTVGEPEERVDEVGLARLNRVLHAVVIEHVEGDRLSTSAVDEDLAREDRRRVERAREDPRAVDDRLPRAGRHDVERAYLARREHARVDTHLVEKANVGVLVALADRKVASARGDRVDGCKRVRPVAERRAVAVECLGDDVIDHRTRVHVVAQHVRRLARPFLKHLAADPVADVASELTRKRLDGEVQLVSIVRLEDASPDVIVVRPEPERDRERLGELRQKPPRNGDVTAGEALADHAKPVGRARVGDTVAAARRRVARVAVKRQVHLQVDVSRAVRAAGARDPEQALQFDLVRRDEDVGSEHAGPEVDRRDVAVRTRR